jgi:hypothetical protein
MSVDALLFPYFISEQEENPREIWSRQKREVRRLDAKTFGKRSYVRNEERKMRKKSWKEKVFFLTVSRNIRKPFAMLGKGTEDSKVRNQQSLKDPRDQRSDSSFEIPFFLL